MSIVQEKKTNRVKKKKKHSKGKVGNFTSFFFSGVKTINDSHFVKGV